MEGVVTFKHLGLPLEQRYNDWPEVIRNINQARRVWGSLGKLLMREGAEPRVATMLYRAVKQELLLFDLETWVILAVMERMVEGTHTNFLRHITVKQA